jgi:hypothetical protein
MVSLLIGKKGRQIHTIMSESGTKIVVSRQFKENQNRPVGIRGEMEGVKKAARMIVTMVEQMLCKMQNFEYRKRPYIDKSTMVVAKLVIAEDLAGAVIGDKGGFLVGLSKQFDLKLKLLKDKKIRSVENNESILVYNLPYP